MLRGKVVPSIIRRKDFSWPFLLAADQFPLLEWTFYAIMSCWWTQLAIGWSTASHYRFFAAAFLAFPTDGLFSGSPVYTHRSLWGCFGLSSSHLPLHEFTASTAACGKQRRASEVPHVKVPSRSCRTPFKAAKQANIDAVSGILDEFPDVDNAGMALSDPVHDVEHHIKTTGPPITAIFQRLEGDKLEAARC
jgi:hypothetical protein